MFDKIEILDSKFFDDCIYPFDTTTGEIHLDRTKDMYEYTKGFTLKEGIEYRTPSKRPYTHSRDLEELIELCQYSKWDKDNSLPVEHDQKLLYLVKTGAITPTQLQMFLMLTDTIQRRNVCITTREFLCEFFNVASKNLSRELSKLDGMVKVISPNGRKSKVRSIIFNPFLVWKGDFSMRNMIIEDFLTRGVKWWDSGVNTGVEDTFSLNQVKTIYQYEKGHGKHAKDCMLSIDINSHIKDKLGGVV